MSISRREAEQLDHEFLEAFSEQGDYSKESAQKAIDAWDNLVRIMRREKNMSNRLGIESIDWQIGNWANDCEEKAWNAHMYEDVIRINEQILEIQWDDSDNLFHENAKREIADAYAAIGRMDECLRLYEEYLKEDPLWGWGWIGYYRQLQGVDEERFLATLDELFQKIKSGTEFRDKENLFRELGDEYNTLGIKERSDYFYALEDAEREKSRQAKTDRVMMPMTAFVQQKVYPNDPCPCGSGKKYKKCCGRNG